MSEAAAPFEGDDLDEEEEDFFPEEVVELPIDGTLDLHAFHPRDVKELVPDYLDACRDEGILEVRVVHGKGTGALRKTVHAILDRLAGIEGYRLAGHGRGSWGATLVTLAPKDEERCQRNRELEARSFEICIEKIKKLKLAMKLVDVEYLFEGQKAIFYFTAEGRIDFRQLVRELATECRVRI